MNVALLLSVAVAVFFGCCCSEYHRDAVAAQKDHPSMPKERETISRGQGGNRARDLLPETRAAGPRDKIPRSPEPP